MRRCLIGIFSLVSAFSGFISCSNQNFGLTSASLKYQARISYNNKVDILWIVDNTPSMAKHQANLAPRANDFLRGLINKGMDFRIAATTPDLTSTGENGAFIGSPKVINPGTADIYNVFSSKIKLPEVDYATEQGLGAMQKAIELRGSTNSGFFRDDAFLVIVVLTNEDDKSPGPSSDYVNYLNNFKPNTKDGEKNWILNLIGVLDANDVNCTTRDRYVEAGYEYMDLADYSNGTKSTICTDDFTAALAGVERRIYEIASKFFLDRTPVVETIEVRIGSRLISEDPVNGWTYNAADNSIQLHGTSISRTNEEISINYEPTSAK